MKNRLLILYGDALSFLKKILILLVLTSILVVAHSFSTMASIYSQTVSINLKNVKFSEAIDEISRQTRLEFAYSKEVVDLNRIVSVSARNSDLRSVLDQLLKGTRLSHTILNGKVYIGPNAIESYIEKRKQIHRVTGTVIDDTNADPLPGVNIIVEGTTIGVITDMSGNYSIETPDASAVLLFSYIGYNTERVQIQGRSVINVNLVPDIKTLSEIVVVGYGSQKKEDVIGSISTINAKDLNIKSASNFDAALQGMAAGVSVQSASGAPGAATVIKIRGTSSIYSSTDPLWIIDGMPVFSSPNGLGGSNQNPMALINQNDIESIQVLKDAAATSIYGSRAANGVILVTTKSGKKGAGSTTFNYSTGISNLTRTPEDVGYVNTQEYFQAMDEAYTNSRLSFTMNEYYRLAPTAFTQITREQAETINTNWFDEYFRTGSFSDYNLSSSGGFERGSFYLSANYRNEKGVQLNNDLNRAAVRANIDFNATKRITLGAKVSLAYTNTENRESGTTKVISYALPWFPVRDPQNPHLYFNPYTGYNAAANTDPNNYKSTVDQYRGLLGLYLNYDVPFVKGLSLRTEGSADLIQSNRVDWRSKAINLDGNNKPVSEAEEEAVTFQGLNYNGYATYAKTFGNHQINVVAGAEATRSSNYARFMGGQGLTGNFQELGVPTTGISLSAMKGGEFYLLGFFGRANYKFKDKYLLGISARRDGSSVFVKENRWGNFIAASAGWIISDEDFMNFLPSGLFLKLRGSYGETGNSNIPTGLNVVNYNPYLVYGSTTLANNGTMPVNIAVDNLQWESTKSTDVGIDYGILKNRINGSVAWYHRYVSGMLLESPAPLSAGISVLSRSVASALNTFGSNNVWGNVGDMVNSGFELELHSVNMMKNGFRWSTDFNIAFNKNLIKKLGDDVDRTGRGLLNKGTVTYDVSRTGFRRKVWYIADWAGVDPLTGIPRIYARDQELYNTTGETQRLKDESGKDSLVLATMTNIRQNRFYQDDKSADPTYFGGITNTFNYKGFDFSFMFVFSGGNYIYDYDRQISAFPNTTRVLLKEAFEQSWRNPGDYAKYPQLRANHAFNVDGALIADFGDFEAFHSRELYKGDFVRLKNVQLGYTVPEKFVQNLKFQGARFYISGTNLLTFTKYPGLDPEGAALVMYSSSIPQLKTFLLGVDVKF